MEVIEQVLLSIPWFAWIAIVAILAGAVKSIVQMTHEHAERMESIRQGREPGPRTFDADSC